MKDVARQKCKASGLKNQLIIGSFSIPQVDYSFELETGKGEGLPVAANNPSLDSGYSARRMRANVRRGPPLSSSRRVTCRKVRRFSLYLLSLAIPCAERQQ